MSYNKKYDYLVTSEKCSKNENFAIFAKCRQATHRLPSSAEPGAHFPIGNKIYNVLQIGGVRYVQDLFCVMQCVVWSFCILRLSAGGAALGPSTGGPHEATKSCWELCFCPGHWGSLNITVVLFKTHFAVRLAERISEILK